jgi:hypothetical protein
MARTLPESNRPESSYRKGPRVIRGGSLGGLFYLVSYVLFVSVLMLVAVSGQAAAQSPGYANISASNQLEYSLEEGTNNEIVEDWFDFDYDLSPFELGFRYELYQPRENLITGARVDSSSTQGITYKYARYRGEKYSVTLGNFYTLFGRGMTLRLYEDRNIRVDNSMEGVLVEANPGRFKLKALTGRMTSNDPARFPTIPRSRVDQLHAVDIEADVVGSLTLGTSYLSSRSKSFVKKELATFRGEASLWLLDLYGEYGKLNDVSENGDGFYFATSFNTAGFGLSVEYKNYDKFAFRASDFTDYNNPPALSREHTYALLNRHPHQLNADDEEGYQIEATWSPDYNTTVLGNVSNTWDSRRAVAAFDYSEELGDSHTKNYSPVVEVEYLLDDINSVRAEFQHQHTVGDTVFFSDAEGDFFWLGEFDHEYILFEYSRAPKWTFSLVTEWTNKIEEQLLPGETKDRTRWIFGSVSYNISESNNISVMYGTRHGGFNCVGGVCRFEPEFKGLEVKLFTRF